MIENNANEKIKNVIEFIEDNIYENLSLEEIADHSKLSKFHLHKLFKYFTGEKLMDYVRQRKLSASVHELIYTDLNIIDIANQYNFEYEQSYIRSFKNNFSISPSRARKEKLPLSLKERASIKYNVMIGENSILFEPSIIHRDSFRVMGIPTIITMDEDACYEEMNKARISFIRNLKRKKILTSEDTFISLVMAHPEDSAFKYYIPCVETSDTLTSINGMEPFQIPSYTYVTFKHIRNNPTEKLLGDISAVHHYLDHWLEDTAYKRLQGACFYEKTELQTANSNFGEYEIFVPVMRR